MGINVEAEKRAYKKFIAAGMTSEGACGLIGNLEAESDGFVPNRVEYLCLQRLKENGKVYTHESYTAAVDSKKISAEEFLHPLPGKQYGYGLAQWTSPGRKSGLYNLAREKEVSIADEDMQIEFLLSELETSYPSVLKVLKTAKSVREASDYVLKHFEQPANTSESVCAGRAARGQKFYDSYVKGEKTMGVRVSNCGHDENNKYSGGQAGDQSGTEWYLCPWYSYPWDYVIRWKDEALANLFADLAIEAAQNNLIGYDQFQRDTFWVNLADSNYRPSQITVPCEADCSSSTSSLIKAVGHLKGIKDLQNISPSHNTWTLTEYFKSAVAQKYFTVLTGKYLTDPSLARRGDINLNTNNHVNITVDNGANSGASAQPATPSANSGLIGTCTPSLHTFLVGAVDKQVKAIQLMLNNQGYKGKDGKALDVDGELGENTAYAIEKFQRDKGMVNINFGTVAAKTWELLLNNVK